MQTDIIIVGGGIVGLTTAYNICQQYPEKHITIIEKEAQLAFHQSGRNSGVLHSGIYYKPGSLKALNCRAGKTMMENFCQREEIRYQICGKVIVARYERELLTLQRIYERGQANGVNCTLIERPRLLELEPHIAGIKAIHVPEAGIVDYAQVCQRLAQRLQENGHNIILQAQVVDLQEERKGIIAITTQGSVNGRYLVNCAGVYSDRITRLSGAASPVQIVPFRGEYFRLKPEASHLCRSLIYPVPDPQFPFLGVHFTLMISGDVECGPNAVLAFGREGYKKLDINLRDLTETLRYQGFQQLAKRHWRMGLGEMWRSASKRAFVNALQQLVPAIEAAHLEPNPAGIRAQAITPDGNLLDDFAFQESNRIVNVVNAPSPGATASLSIGKMIVEKLATRFD